MHPNANLSDNNNFLILGFQEFYKDKQNNVPSAYTKSSN